MVGRIHTWFSLWPFICFKGDPFILKKLLWFIYLHTYLVLQDISTQHMVLSSKMITIFIFCLWAYPVFFLFFFLFFLLSLRYNLDYIWGNWIPYLLSISFHVFSDASIFYLFVLVFVSLFHVSLISAQILRNYKYPSVWISCQLAVSDSLNACQMKMNENYTGALVKSFFLSSSSLKCQYEGLQSG